MSNEPIAAERISDELARRVETLKRLLRTAAALREECQQTRVRNTDMIARSQALRREYTADPWTMAAHQQSCARGELALRIVHHLRRKGFQATVWDGNSVSMPNANPAPQRVQ